MIETAALVACAAVLAAGVWVLAGPALQRRRVRPWYLLVPALAAMGALGFAWPAPDVAAPDLPRPSDRDGYVTSSSCRACHPGPYASWHDTYHRTMTQRASPSTVRGNFSDVHLERGPLSFDLRRDEDRFLVSFVDGGGVRQDKEIRLVTGSHHYQVYWGTSGRGNELVVFPFVWLLAEQRWVPRDSAFVSPPGSPEADGGWNVGCIRCHATRGVPRGLDDGSFDTEVGELGISCEACHGPGRLHVEAHRSPLKRYLLGGDVPDDIVNPARLDPTRGAQVCGQCHSVNAVLGHERYNAEGLAFKPGQDLEATRKLLRPEDFRDPVELERMGLKPDDDHGALLSRFWADGAVRIAGRELTGLERSACFRGGLACTECHSMHGAPPSDQLKDDDGDAPCLRCHESYRADRERHTHHRPDSEGSRCLNCHMPHQTFSLLSGIRTHTIQSPSAQESLELGRPNACNLCHLDQTVKWTAEHLAAWTDKPAPDVPAPHDEVPAAAVWLLSGDAGVRALAAWAASWEPARQISGDRWLEPLLAPLLDDEYDAVRFVAARSLASLPGGLPEGYDFLAPKDARHQAAALLWQPADTDGAGGRLEHGKLSVEAMEALLANRDRRPVILAE